MDARFKYGGILHHSTLLQLTKCMEQRCEESQVKLVACCRTLRICYSSIHKTLSLDPIFIHLNVELDIQFL